MPSARSRGPPMETRSASTLSIPDSRSSNPRRTRSPPGSGSPSTAPIIGPAAPARGWPALAATLPAVKLTVTVITLNEADHIEFALSSVAWADEIIVIDSGSTDGTVDIARRHATRVEVLDWPGYGAQKNRAADLASNDWILSLDADEHVPADLADEIRRVLEHPDAAGYRIPRVTWYLGRWIRSTDWYPDPQLRLYDRRAGRWSLRQVHESVELSQPPGRLRHELQHYAYRDVSHHLATIDRYTDAGRGTVDGGRQAHLRARGGRPPAARVPAQLRASWRLSGRRRRPARLRAQLVLRVPEAREAMGAAAAGDQGRSLRHHPAWKRTGHPPHAAAGSAWTRAR